MLQPERLLEIKEALLFGDPLDAAARLDLLAIVEFASSHKPNPRGRPTDKTLRQRAGVVGVLHEKHGFKLELALNIVALQVGAEDVRRRDRESLKTAYRKLRSSGQSVRVPEREVVAALARAMGG